MSTVLSGVALSRRRIVIRNRRRSRQPELRVYGEFFATNGAATNGERGTGFGFRDARCFETEVRRQEKGLFVGWRDDLRVVRVRGGCMSCPWSGQRALYGRSMHGLRAAKLELGVPRRWVRSGRRTLLIREAGWNVIHLNPVLNAPLTRYT
jgi:hypothetical protein